MFRLHLRWHRCRLESTSCGSLTRGGSTSVRGRVRSPHISGGQLAAGSQRADSLGSQCAIA